VNNLGNIPLGTWNDMPGRTYEEVMLALRRSYDALNPDYYTPLETCPCFMCENRREIGKLRVYLPLDRVPEPTPEPEPEPVEAQEEAPENGASTVPLSSISPPASPGLGVGDSPVEILTLMERWFSEPGRMCKGTFREPITGGTWASTGGEGMEKLCISGALHAFTSETVLQNVSTNTAAFRLLQQAIKLHDPEHYPADMDPNDVSIIGYNDRSDVTQEDILAVVRIARQLAEGNPRIKALLEMRAFFRANPHMWGQGAYFKSSDGMPGYSEYLRQERIPENVECMCLSGAACHFEYRNGISSWELVCGLDYAVGVFTNGEMNSTVNYNDRRERTLEDIIALISKAIEIEARLQEV
jgi:hypothetical protein